MSDTYQAKVRPEKVEAVREIAERISRSEALVLTEYRGLTVTELGELRTALIQADVEYKVVKNTLARFAVRDQGIDGLDETLEGPTAVAFCYGDPVGAAKALSDFAKDHPALVIKGGVMAGRVLSPEDTKALATIDSLEVSLAKITGSLQSPLQAMVGALEGALRQIVYVLQNFPADAAAKGEEAEAEAPAEREAPAPAEPEAEAPAAEPAAEEAAAEPEAESTEASAEEPAAEPESEASAAEPAAEEPPAAEAEASTDEDETSSTDDEKTEGA